MCGEFLQCRGRNSLAGGTATATLPEALPEALEEAAHVALAATAVTGGADQTTGSSEAEAEGRVPEATTGVDG